jgi:hypothetical protein
LNNLFNPYHFKEDLTLDRSKSFIEKSFDIFQVQSRFNPLYRDYLSHLGVNVEKVTELTKIPFLPISFFKSHTIKTGDFEPEVYFESSGTTGVQNSRHGILSQTAYLLNTAVNFTEFYGNIDDYCILALLPSYLERGNSSLVAMADYFIKLSKHPLSGFFLHNIDRLHEVLGQLEKDKQPTILLGVTFALMDFAEKFPMQLEHTIVMETGGMKGRREELTRAQLHSFLCERLGVEQIHAEYGMTELQSQAYSMGGGWFKTSSTMKVLLRSLDDPFEVWEADQFPMRTGAVNLIDLANSDTISFIATDDVGRFRNDGFFEITGRMDNCDIRGCSQLAL